MRKAPRRLVTTACLLFPVLLSGCPEPPPPPEADNDGDGFTVSEGDCADLDPNRFPGAEELCNQVDDNCDTRVDEQFDLDQDGASSCTQGGDCNDTDPSSFPGNDEISDGIDNDCNGIIDDGLVDFDDDGDGFCEIGPCVNTEDPASDGDCNDDIENETSHLINPDAIEVVGDKVDNNCNGATDEPLEPCDSGLTGNTELDFAKAIGLCNGEVLSATFKGPSSPNARAILPGFGVIEPSEGSSFLVFSTGDAGDNSDSPSTNLSPSNTFAHPAPVTTIPPGNTCSEPDEDEVNDYTELELVIRVPSNAQSFSYRFQFLSVEYVTFRCSQFDDTFLALMNSDAFEGNISFDAQGNVVSINNGFFQICEDDNRAGVPPNDCQISGAAINTAIGGTGYEDHGATLPLTTTAPVVPGETILLRFILFDEGDHILDSTVIIDQFQWLAEPADGGPITVP